MNKLIDNITIASNDNYPKIASYINKVDVNKEVASDIESQATSTLNLNVIKTTIRNTVSLNEPVQYKIEVSNTSNVALTNVYLMDYLPINASLVQGSITVDGTSPNGSIFDFSGLSLGNLAIGASTTIEYSISFYNLPVTNPVKIYPKLNYSYVSNQTTINETFTGVSTSLNVIKDPIGVMNLFTNASTISSGDTVLYTLILQNNGTKTATNVNLTDVIPKGLTFIPNSLILNGSPLPGDITAGIKLPDMTTGAQYLITFEVSAN